MGNVKLFPPVRAKESRAARTPPAAFAFFKIYPRGSQMRGTTKTRPTYYTRPEKDPALRALWEHNKKIILQTQSVCGICGKPVNKSLKYPDPMCATVDHIIPVARNGDPTALDNLQLAHKYCNRMKSDKLLEQKKEISDVNRDLPQSVNWRTF